jgi:hypothetical protein
VTGADGLCSVVPTGIVNVVFAASVVFTVAVVVTLPVTERLFANVALFEVSIVINSELFCCIPEFNTPALSVIVIIISGFMKVRNQQQMDIL